FGVHTHLQCRTIEWMFFAEELAKLANLGILDHDGSLLGLRGNHIVNRQARGGGNSNCRWAGILIVADQSESSRRTAFRPSTRDPPRSRPGRAVPSPIPWARPWAGREAGGSRRRRRDSEAASRQRRPGRRSCRPSETAGGCRRGWDRRRRARGGGFAGRGGQRSRSDGRGVLALAPGRPFATVETCGSRKQERDGAGMLDPERIVLHYDGALVGVRAKVAFEAHPLSIIGRGINDRVGAIVAVRVGVRRNLAAEDQNVVLGLGAEMEPAS